MAEAKKLGNVLAGIDHGCFYSGIFTIAGLVTSESGITSGQY